MDVGIIGFKLLERELVVVGLHVAELRLALGDESQGGLEAHDEVALLLGLLLGESEELEHIDDKLLVGVADVGRGLVVVEVVLALAERQSALVDVEDIHLRVLLVGAKAHTHGHAVAEDAILALHFLQVGDGAGRLHLRMGFTGATPSRLRRTESMASL